MGHPASILFKVINVERQYINEAEALTTVSFQLPLPVGVNYKSRLSGISFNRNFRKFKVDIGEQRMWCERDPLEYGGQFPVAIKLLSRDG